jgi:hypothetical protein
MTKRKTNRILTVIAAALIATIAVVGYLVWQSNQPISVRIAAENFASAMVSCDGNVLFDLATPQEQSKYDADKFAKVCRAVRDDMIGGLKLISAVSTSKDAAQSGSADARFRAADGTEFDCGTDVSRHDGRPVGSVVLQMRFMVMRYIMAKHGADVQSARAIFTREYLDKFKEAGAIEIYLLPKNEWAEMR